MTNENLYGVDSTDNVEYDKQGLPVGNAMLVMVIGEESAKDHKGVVMELEILDGDHKGRKGKVWILTKHSSAQTANIAKQTLKRIADATGKAVSPSSPLKGRVFRIDVAVQKKDDRYTEIKRYLPESHVPEETAPF